MDLYAAFTAFIHAEKLFHSRDRLLIAVSGGVDSVVLCHLCHLAGYDFSLAHANFQLRGEESQRDEDFVRQLADGFKRPVFVRSFDTRQYASANKCSVQVAARELRYRWFDELLARPSQNDLHAQADAKALFFDRILTAHQLDDNAETIAMNFFKGTGLAGMHGILPIQAKLVRPLLFAKKEDIVAYARNNQLLWVEDSSNSSDNYTRNYFRHQVFPVVEQVFPAARQNLAHNAVRFREIELIYQRAIEAEKNRLLEKKGNEVHIPVLKLSKTPATNTILFEILREYHFTPGQTAAVTGLLQSESGKWVESPTHRVIRNRKWLIITPRATHDSGIITIDDQSAEIHFAGGNLTIDSITINKSHAMPAHIQDQFKAFLDAKLIRFPLLLRRWKAGDYFYPLGMKKKKKISRFLIDLKLSKPAKEKIWVLEMDKKIIWVIGLRIDDRFKLNPVSSDSLVLTFTPEPPLK